MTTNTDKDLSAIYANRNLIGNLSSPFFADDVDVVGKMGGKGVTKLSMQDKSILLRFGYQREAQYLRAATEIAERLTPLAETIKDHDGKELCGREIHVYTMRKNLEQKRDEMILRTRDSRKKTVIEAKMNEVINSLEKDNSAEAYLSNEEKNQVIDVNTCVEFFKDFQKKSFFSNFKYDNKANYPKRTRNIYRAIKTHTAKIAMEFDLPQIKKSLDTLRKVVIDGELKKIEKEKKQHKYGFDLLGRDPDENKIAEFRNNITEMEAYFEAIEEMVQGVNIKHSIIEANFAQQLEKDARAKELVDFLENQPITYAGFISDLKSHLRMNEKDSNYAMISNLALVMKEYTSFLEEKDVKAIKERINILVDSLPNGKHALDPFYVRIINALAKAEREKVAKENQKQRETQETPTLNSAPDSMIEGEEEFSDALDTLPADTPEEVQPEQVPVLQSFREQAAANLERIQQFIAGVLELGNGVFFPHSEGV